MSEFNPERIKQKAKAAAQSALFMAGEKVAGKSQQAVPRDTGALARSMYVKTESSAQKVSCIVGYSAEHASYVHDGDGKNAGFLTRPFNDMQSECKRMIHKAVEEAVR